MKYEVRISLEVVTEMTSTELMDALVPFVEALPGYVPESDVMSVYPARD